MLLQRIVKCKCKEQYREQTHQSIPLFKILNCACADICQCMCSLLFFALAFNDSYHIKSNIRICSNMVHLLIFILYFVSVNHKTEDEILRSLNRHAQRKLLSTLQDTRYERHDPEASHVSDEQTLER